MSPLCPTVVVGLPGTPGSVKTRAYQFFLGVCGLSGTSRNLPEPRNGACYGRCTLSATTRNVLAWRPRPPSCATPGRSSPRPRKPTGAGSTEATTANPMPRSTGSEQALPTPEIKQADRAKPGSHHLRETRGGSYRQLPCWRLVADRTGFSQHHHAPPQRLGAESRQSHRRLSSPVAIRASKCRWMDAATSPPRIRTPSSRFRLKAAPERLALVSKT